MQEPDPGEVQLDCLKPGPASVFANWNVQLVCLLPGLWEVQSDCVKV